MQTMPAVEGLTPVILWYTLTGLVGLGALLVLADKVAEVFRKSRKRREERQEREESSGQSRHARLIHRLDAIDDYIRENDRNLDRSNRRLSSLESNVTHIERGISALARAELAHIQHDLTGNHSDNLGRAEKEITNYLTGKGVETHE